MVSHTIQMHFALQKYIYSVIYESLHQNQFNLKRFLRYPDHIRQISTILVSVSDDY